MRRPRHLAASTPPVPAAPSRPRLQRRPRRVIDLRDATKIYDTGAVQVAALPKGAKLEIELIAEV